MPKTWNRKKFKQKAINRAERGNLRILLTSAMYQDASFFARGISRLPFIGGQIETKATELAEKCYLNDPSAKEELIHLSKSEYLSAPQKQTIKKVLHRLNRIEPTSNEQCAIAHIEQKQNLKQDGETFEIKNPNKKGIAHLDTKITSGFEFSVCDEFGSCHNPLLDCLEKSYDFKSLTNASSSPTSSFFNCETSRTACAKTWLGTKFCTTIRFTGKFDQGCFFTKPCNETIETLSDQFPPCFESNKDSYMKDTFLYIMFPMFGLVGLCFAFCYCRHGCYESKQEGKSDEKTPFIVKAG